MSKASNHPLANNASLFKVFPATRTGESMALAFGSAKRWIPRTVVTPDYTNQLDLFSDTDIDTQAPVAPVPARVSGNSHARPRPPEQLDFGALEPLPPEDLAELRSQNRLEKALEDTAEQFSDFLYEMVSVRKMEYHRAWELAIDQFLLPEESSSTSNPSPSPPATSGSRHPTG
jgi:hypothetical protein